MKLIINYPILTLILLSLIFVKCEKDSLDSGADVAPAELVMKKADLGKGSVLTKIQLSGITGATSDLDSALGVLDLIEIRSVDGTWLQIWDSIEPFDFLDLEKGILNDVAIVPIPTGLYTDVRCRIRESKVVYQGKDYDCIIPGGDMILAFDVPLVVGAQLSPEVKLEIDVSNTFYPVYSASLYKQYMFYLMKLKRKGNWRKEYVTFDEFKKNKKPKAFIMNPVITAVNTTSKGSIAGGVLKTDPTYGLVPFSGATLELWQDGVLVANTTAFKSMFFDEYNTQWNPGDFLFKDILEGDYTLKVVEPGYNMFDPEFDETGNIIGLNPMTEFNVFVLKGNFNFVTASGAIVMDEY